MIACRRVRFRLPGLLLLLLLTVTACRDKAPAPAADPSSDAFGTLAADAVKLLVSHDGMVRVSLAELQKAGLAQDALDTGAINLTLQGTPVPYLIDGDGLVFYGQAPSSRYTATRAYIVRGGEAGLSMGSGPAAAAETVQQTVGQQITLEQNRIYTSNARNVDSEEVWYWEVIQPGAVTTISTTLPVVADAPATLQATFYGASYNQEVDLDHDLEVVVNDSPIGQIQWDGQAIHEATLAIPGGVLRSGNNVIRFDNSAPGAAFVDIMQLDRVTLSYSAPPQAVDDRLHIVDTAGTVPLTGFSSPPRVFDVSDPALPLLVTPADGGSLTVRADQSLLAVGPAGYGHPAATLGLRSSDWQSAANGADLLIITTDGLLPALDPLVAAREAEGLRVAAVPLAEIYDLFGYGEESPLPLARFIAYAYENWQAPAPRYLLLVGDATYDFRGYLGAPPANLVPSPIVKVAYSGETVSDSQLGDIDGDGIPEIAVGRWPVTEPEQVSDLIKRTLAYESGSASALAVFTADGTEEQFAVISDRLVSGSNLAETGVERLYGATATEVTEAWNQGAWLVTYTGHGSLDQWGRDDVLSQEAAASLGSDLTPPIVLQFTCLTGFFAHPRIQSLTEAMILNTQGPVLLLGASSLTLSTHQEPLAAGLLAALQDSEYPRIGDALLAAKRSLNVDNAGIREVSETFGLFGDPSAHVVRPAGSSG